MPNNQPKDVFAIVERGQGQKAIWIRVGAAFVNQDGSLNIRLDAVPLTGTLQVRERQQDRRRQPQGDQGGYHEPQGGHREQSYRGNNGGGPRNGSYPI